MRRNQPPCTQQTWVGTWMWHGVTLASLLFSLSQTCHMSLLYAVVLFTLKCFCSAPSSKAEFLQRRGECGIKDGILVIKAIEFPVDLRRDLNAPCLHSWWGGAGNINDSPLNLIVCQKQSLWGVGLAGIWPRAAPHTPSPLNPYTLLQSNLQLATTLTLSWNSISFWVFSLLFTVKCFYSS